MDRVFSWAQKRDEVELRSSQEQAVQQALNQRSDEPRSLLSSEPTHAGL